MKFPYRFVKWARSNVQNENTSKIWDSQQIATNWDMYSLVCYINVSKDIWFVSN